MKVFVINGPNLNMLGIREPHIYGAGTYDELCALIHSYASQRGIEVEMYQSNHEGDLVDKIQSAYGNADGIIINPAAYTHTSVAILDALQAVNLPTVEVHITDTTQREEYRRVSYISAYCAKSIIGHGQNGYLEALEYLTQIVEA